MDKLIIALLETSAGLMLFYFVFAVWLKKETFFKENRFYLLLTAGFSLLIPWINFSLPNQNTNTLILYNLLDVVSVSANGYEQSLVQQITAWQWLFGIYAMGVVFMLGLMVVKFIKITRIGKVSNHTFSDTIPANVKFIQVDVAPFSFLNNIYINPDNYSQKQVNEIIAHESVHVMQQHTYDCLFYEFLIVFFWFNPIVYKYRTSAKELHEYLADEGAIKSGISEEVYQKLLFEQATGVSMLTLANSFNYSLIKRRLIMLTKIKSSKWTKFRMLFVLPVLVGLLIVFACNQVNNEELTNVENASKKHEMTADGAYYEVEEMPEFEGGDLALRQYIAENVKYPEQAKVDGIQGKVFIEFIVDETGSVSNAKIARSVNKLLDDEAIRVVSSIPKWKPGVHKGKNVKVQFTIPINFALK